MGAVWSASQESDRLVARPESAVANSARRPRGPRGRSRAAIVRWVTIFLLALANPFGLALPAPRAAQAASAKLPGGIDTVFLLIFENHDWATIKGSSSVPYLNGLLRRPDAAYASNYHNVPTGSSLHPSEPNYLWLEGATNVYPDHTFTSDDSPSANNSTSSTKHLVTLLNADGIAWKAYEEDISDAECPIQNSGNYTPRHNGILFFQDVVGTPPSTSNAYCQQHVRPYSELTDDLDASRVAGYNVVIPNLCHDMHSNSCPGSSNVVRQGDDWLAANLPTILNSPVYQSGHALIAITWDEGGSGNNPIGMILLSPQTKGNGYTNTLAYNHASWVKTVEELFGLSPLVGHAADPETRDLGDLFVSGGGSSPHSPRQPGHRRDGPGRHAHPHR